MELRIENFTDAGNHLKWRSGWKDYQHKHCETKTHARLANKMHYDRILDSLTDNRSIDVLVDKSLKNVKKMDDREYIAKFVEENYDKQTIEQLVRSVAIAMNISVQDQEYRQLYNIVLEEMNFLHGLNQSRMLAPRRIDIAINGKDVGIQASPEGVVATENPISITGVSSVHTDEETGERGITIWSGDNQAPERRGMTLQPGFLGSGERITFDPMQFSVPTRLPPRMIPVQFNREALPDTTQLPYQVEPRYLQGPPQSQSASPYQPEPLQKPQMYIRSHTNEPVSRFTELEDVGTQTEEQGYPPMDVTEQMFRRYGVKKLVKEEGGKQTHITQTVQTGSGGLPNLDVLKEFSLGGGAGTSYSMFRNPAGQLKPVTPDIRAHFIRPQSSGGD